MTGDALDIATWRHDRDIAFVWGIDELGNIGSKKADFADWGLYLDRPESYFQSKFLPTIERHPRVTFTLGVWLGRYDGVTPSEDLHPDVRSLEPNSIEWQDWIDRVIVPANKHDQLSLVAHGLGHEDWVTLDESERHERLERIVQLFKQAVGTHPSGFNTWPYGTIPRDSMPSLFCDHDLFVTGILTTQDLSIGQRIQGVLRRLRTGKRYRDVRNSTKKIGAAVRQAPEFEPRIGEMSYWKGNDHRIVALPYTGELKGNSVEDITKRVSRLVDRSGGFDAPAFYMFSHLRGTSPEQRSPARNPDGIEGQHEKFERLLSYLSNSEALWCTSLTQAAMYYDVRTSGLLTTEQSTDGLEFALDTSACLPWPGSVYITFRMKTENASSLTVKMESSDKKSTVETYSGPDGTVMFDYPVEADDCPITGQIRV